MGALDHQFGFKKEVTFNTPLVVDRFAEYEDNGTPIKPVAGRSESNPLRVGSRFRRQGRAIPYLDHAEGTIPMVVMTKGFGFWVEHLLGNVATTGAGPFTHTGTEGASSSLMGKSFTGQLNYPFHPSGTNQALTCSGGKVLKWKLGNTVDNHLMIELDAWFASMTTVTALATAAYPATPFDPLSWTGGVVTVGGAAFDITNFALEVDQGYNLKRKQIRGNPASKEPTPGQVQASFALEADFVDLTQFNRVHSATVAGMSAQIIGTWSSGTNTLVATIPGGRFDELSFGGDRGAIEQSLSGIVEFDGTNSGVTLAYTTPDTTP